MKLFTKLATGAAAVGLAATGALAVLGSGSAAAHVPAVVHLANITRAAPTQAAPTQVAPSPAPNTGSSTAVEPAAGAEAPDTGAEAPTEPANEPTPPGGGHADAPGATVDHQFDGVE